MSGVVSPLSCHRDPRPPRIVGRHNYHQIDNIHPMATTAYTAVMYREVPAGAQ